MYNVIKLCVRLNYTLTLSHLMTTTNVYGQKYDERSDVIGY